MNTDYILRKSQGDELLLNFFFFLCCFGRKKKTLHPKTLKKNYNLQEYYVKISKRDIEKLRLLWGSLLRIKLAVSIALFPKIYGKGLGRFNIDLAAAISVPFNRSA